MQDSNPKVPELDKLAVCLLQDIKTRLEEKECWFHQDVTMPFICFSILATLISSSWLMPSGWQIYFSWIVSQLATLCFITTTIHGYLLHSLYYFWASCWSGCHWSACSWLSFVSSLSSLCLSHWVCSPQSPSLPVTVLSDTENSPTSSVCDI